MAKKTEIRDRNKIRGIRRRWLLNSVSIVLLILALALGSFAAVLYNYYYTSTENDLLRKASSMSNGFRIRHLPGLPRPVRSRQKNA
jgi:hypothetical protein